MNDSLPEYKVSDYGIFSDAISSINNVNENLSNADTALKDCKTRIDDDSIFMGPVSDSCVAGFGKVDLKIEDNTSKFSTMANHLIQVADAYNKGDTAAMNTILSATDGTTTSTTGNVVTNGNVIDASNPVTSGNKYNLSDDDLSYLAYVAMKEQGSVDGAKLELSLMANLYEQNKNNYSNVRDYVENSGWFATSSTSGYSYPGDDYVNASREILNGGSRYLPANVNEHDYIGDISSISTGSKNDRSDYVPGKTVIHNKMGSTYTFVGFAPNDGDPFGYIV